MVRVRGEPAHWRRARVARPGRGSAAHPERRLLQRPLPKRRPARRGRKLGQKKRTAGGRDCARVATRRACAGVRQGGTWTTPLIQVHGGGGSANERRAGGTKDVGDEATTDEGIGGIADRLGNNDQSGLDAGDGRVGRRRFRPYSALARPTSLRCQMLRSVHGIPFPAMPRR